MNVSFFLPRRAPSFSPSRGCIASRGFSSGLSNFWKSCDNNKPERRRSGRKLRCFVVYSVVGIGKIWKVGKSVFLFNSIKFSSSWISIENHASRHRRPSRRLSLSQLLNPVHKSTTISLAIYENNSIMSSSSQFQGNLWLFDNFLIPPPPSPLQHVRLARRW